MTRLASLEALNIGGTHAARPPYMARANGACRSCGKRHDKGAPLCDDAGRVSGLKCRCGRAIAHHRPCREMANGRRP